MVERKVLLPGVTVLAHQAIQVRDRAPRCLCRTLARVLNRRQAARLDIHYESPCQSLLKSLRIVPSRVSKALLVEALIRQQEIRAQDVIRFDLSIVPPVRSQPPACGASIRLCQGPEVTALDDVSA